MQNTHPIILICIAAYITVIVVVGIYLTRKKVKNSDDFVVANRSLPTIVLIGTLLATWCGAGGITGSANMIWQNGPLFGILIFIGAPIGMILLYLVSGKCVKQQHIQYRSCLNFGTELRRERLQQYVLYWGT